MENNDRDFTGSNWFKMLSAEEKAEYINLKMGQERATLKEKEAKAKKAEQDASTGGGVAKDTKDYISVAMACIGLATAAIGLYATISKTDFGSNDLI